MNKPSADCRGWEKAFVNQSHDAAVGRFFKGIIHNMNGDIQALSMQAELFAMLFGQVDEAFAKALASTEPGESRQALEDMQNLLRRRASLLPQMQQAVKSLKETARGAVKFGESIEGIDKEDASINAIIRCAEKFYCADSFFKHKVERKLLLTDSLPPVQGQHLVLRYIVEVLLANALAALQKKPEPPWVVEITTRWAGDSAEIIVQDNGIGIDLEDQGHIFEPFFSTWPGSVGLGLYLARQEVAAMGGSISFTSDSGCTRFSISLPTDRI